jgi:hypothetical protein
MLNLIVAPGQYVRPRMRLGLQQQPLRRAGGAGDDDLPGLRQGLQARC